MKSAEFGIVFGGKSDSLAAHQISVQTLAPSLLALGEVLSEANRVLNGDRARVELNVKATAPGSFCVALELAQTLADQLQAVFTKDNLANAKELTGMVFGSGGLWALLLFLQGQKADKVTEVGDQVTLEAHGMKVTFPTKVAELYKSEGIRVASRRALEPLQGGQVERVDITLGGNTQHTITRPDLEHFDLPPLSESDTEILTETHKRACRIVRLSFRDGNKWRLNDGQSEFSATIEDEVFLERVDSGQEAFATDDTLICNVRMTQAQAADGSLKTSYAIVGVVEHRKAARQLHLL